MAKIVRISDPNYKISVADGGEITLDTGAQTGVVRITGDLIVEGETTTINTTNLAIEDRIIDINVNDPGPQITGGTAGIRINRGTSPSFPDVGIFFDESLSYLDSQFAQNRIGGFSLRDDNDKLVGLQTNAIITISGADLILLGATQGEPTVSVRGSADYELRVTDDDDIPNRKFVELFVENYFETVPPEFIRAGDSTLQIFDESQDPETVLKLTLNSQLSAEFRPNRVEMQEIRVAQNTVSTFTENRDLIISANGIGSVVVNDILKITNALSEPVVETDGVKIYTGQQAYGGSGIYFVNAESTRDELISRRKAIAYSMIF
jgi:hypothetical protein